MIASSVIKTELITQHFIIRGGKKHKGQFNRRPFFFLLYCFLAGCL